ncbi:hypothetical protein LX36DRAFT_661983 [Colletotrichum falcatum]|nr:hypothetical protein LX36DRAFT_661983 [Colletotrichum falcatum]
MAPVTLTEDQLLGLHSIPSYDYRMSSHTSTAQTPATASTDASSQVDYFTSSQSSATNSSRNSVELQDGTVTVETPGGTITTQKTKNRLPPLSREFPKPAEEIDVEEALARKPGRWTVRGALAVERPAQVVDEEKLKAQRRQALEDAKKELFAASEMLKTATLPSRKDF